VNIINVDRGCFCLTQWFGVNRYIWSEETEDIVLCCQAKYISVSSTV